MKSRLSNIFIGVSCLLIYFLYSSVCLSILELLNIDYDALPLIIKASYLLIVSILEMVLFYFIFKHYLKECFSDLKSNHETYFKKYFKFWPLILVVMAVSNLFINVFLKSGIAGNENAVRMQFGKAPFYVWFSSVFYAPFIEELVFRKAIRNIIKNDTLFILVSGIFFGGLHVVTGFSSFIDLLYLIPYCTPGIIFSYLLVKTDNVLVPMSMHFMHNGILMSLQVFMRLFLS